MKRKILSCLLCGILSLFMFNLTMAAEDETQGDKSGIGDIKKECITGFGKGCFDYEKDIIHSTSLDETNEHKTVLTVLQDVVLGATFMVGTVLMIVIIYCGLMYIFAAGDGKDPKQYQKGLINAAIGALFVWGGYAIVRLIQYIAKG